MPEPLRTAPAKLYGRRNWIFVPTIASATLAPTVAEASGASSLDITNIAFLDGAPNPTAETALVEMERRFGDTLVFEGIGETKYSGGDITYAFDAQGVAASNPVKLWEKWLNVSGTVTGFLVDRMNVPKSTAIAAGQFVHVYPAEIGPSMPGGKGEGPTAEGSATCKWAATAQPAFKVAVLA
ncbi:phage tail tube protein [Pimelobacter simplex]|uniref:phage tail tube protein n=1 Tax=Nocardioides simplex TaxID=2045 RepID=UPI00214F9313|nr:hypothetical protein [Pimelobacter simplex]UUW88402.1 hypothetical protein M0M43_22020 [Pimelobacter simplex]UUW97906.1 hypothetical protein M0M48_10665 [Pimelobacter simplex]